MFIIERSTSNGEIYFAENRFRIKIDFRQLDVVARIDWVSVFRQSWTEKQIVSSSVACLSVCVLQLLSVVAAVWSRGHKLQFEETLSRPIRQIPHESTNYHS